MRNSEHAGSSYSTHITDGESWQSVGNPKNPIIKEEKVSKAMRAYLERARQHGNYELDLVAQPGQQLLNYNIGKRHLANMMGEDPETFTQKDIDSAIQYLFPSGIFTPGARPLMKHPDEVFPPRKAAEFDESGRPHHFLFYTSKPNFYQDVVEHMNSLNEFEDKMIKKRLLPDPLQAVNLTGSQWLPKEQLEKLLVESLSDKDYQNFIVLMDRLVEHPYSYRVKSFYEAYRKPLLSQTKTYDIPKPLYDADGRAYITTKECLRKTARGEVTLRSPGTGKIQINGEGVDYFKDNQPREQLLFPLVFTGLLGAVDVEATVAGGGSSGQAGAIRWGISWGLRSFVDREMVEKMRLAGLLTRDYRKKERKKPGQEGARRKYTWKKR
uniref:Small ribosomal subunit protein uS9m n=1 Tax=Timema cristinae TaxID=61476 RepID=A0A7R9CGE1_TIMCR|nr:unnamed protein product [Timema cristinae]